MQAKYVIISQYWKQVVVKSNDLLRLPSRLWGLLNVTELIHLLPPKCFFPPFRNCDSGHSAEDIFYMISCLWNFIKVLIHSYLLEAGKKSDHWILLSISSFFSVSWQWQLIVCPLCRSSFFWSMTFVQRSCFKNFFTNSIPSECP